MVLIVITLEKTLDLRIQYLRWLKGKIEDISKDRSER